MNINDIVEIHDELNPKLWYDNNLRREVEYKLLQIAMAFIKFINLPGLKLVDVTISGSNASFNYNSNSDIDLHLVVDESSECIDELKELYLAKKSLFNDQHDISIRDINVEVYVQEANQPHVSNGIYSILRDEWLKQPKLITDKPDATNARHKFDFLQHEILEVIKSKDLAKMEKVKADLKKMRQSGLETNGEFGAENLAYKMLRNKGLLDKLWDSATQAQDEKLSI